MHVNTHVASIDGEVFPIARARRIAKGLFFAGFAGLPLLWITNVWLFWPCFRSHQDKVITQYVRWSLVGSVAASIIFLPWLLFFSAFGRAYFSPEVYAQLDVTRIPVRQFGV
mmetsp:Transcript_7480/g.19937  ORF Transcript_7480/g.19937 Transcript_7480/m.19937 type:complete len:112 (+) Transcript_7480:120-455(+)